MPQEIGAENIFNIAFEAEKLMFRSNGQAVHVPGDWSDNQWHHFAMTVNRGFNVANIYVDKELRTTFATDSLGGISGGTPLIGAALYKEFDAENNVVTIDTRNWLTGNIDEFCFFAQALPQTLINTYSKKSPNGDEAGLKTYLGFDRQELQSDNTIEMVPYVYSKVIERDADGNIVYELDPETQKPTQTPARKYEFTDGEDVIMSHIDKAQAAPVLPYEEVTNLKYSFIGRGNQVMVELDEAATKLNHRNVYVTLYDVEDKYGASHVSRVITFGTMAAKSAIKDVARISHVSIDESNRLTKMVPDRLSDEKGNDVKVTLKNCLRLVPDMKKELESGPLINQEVLKYAAALEGSVRQVGMHACATIIGRGDLTDYLPITLSKDKETGLDVRTSQYDGHYIEDVGMLKMDFLGLITLAIIHNCLDLIKAHHGEEIDIEAIPINDKATLDLYGRGDTTSVFQFESEGMKSWLQRLRPERFEDLIAMNALYRPGPMDYIPDFVARKQGEQKIEYDLPEMTEYLQDTYGVTVYQEQVMLLSQRLAGFTKGEADKLRKAMGKKQIDILNSLKDKFMSGGKANGHPEKVLDKIWKDWEKFAQYAFNKSHATCYAWVSYQTGWLKAHYPSEFFASCLNNAKSMEEIIKIMDDAKGHGISVLSPDINESAAHFTVNKDGNVRFALGSIKGFGANVVDAIIHEREEKGLFSDVYDFVERMAGNMNRKSFESLVNSGALDSFGHKRSMYFQLSRGGEPFIDLVTRYGDLYANDTVSSGASLFGDMEEMKPERPALPDNEGEMDIMELLQREKELVGMYLSSHPLDRYSFEMHNFTNCHLADLNQLVADCEAQKKTTKVYVAGIVTDCKQLTTKAGKPFSRTLLEDYSGSYELTLFGNDHESFLQYMTPKATLFLEGTVEEKYPLRAEERAQGKTAPYAFKVRKVTLLGNITDNILNGFSMDITTPMLTQEFRKQLVDVVKRHKGDIPLTLYLYDPQTRYRIQFYSKKYQVAVTSEFIRDLNDIGIDQYEVIRK